MICLEKFLNNTCGNANHVHNPYGYNQIIMYDDNDDNNDYTNQLVDSIMNPKFVQPSNDCCLNEFCKSITCLYEDTTCTPSVFNFKIFGFCITFGAGHNVLQALKQAVEDDYIFSPNWCTLGNLCTLMHKIFQQMYYVELEHPGITKLFLEMGGNPYKKNANGKNAIDLIDNKNNLENIVFKVIPRVRSLKVIIVDEMNDLYSKICWNDKLSPVLKRVYTPTIQMQKYQEYLSRINLSNNLKKRKLSK